MKHHSLPARKLNSRGFSHHFLLPLIVVVAVVAIGTYTFHAIHAASAQYYVGPCTGTTYTKVGTSGPCVNQAKDLMDGLQHAGWRNYKTATKLVSGSTFKYGNQYYLDLNKVYDASTQEALKALTGSSVGLTPGTGASAGWQVFCTTVAKSGINLSANKYGGAMLDFKNGNKTGQTMSQIFKATCGQLTLAKKSGSSSSSKSSTGAVSGSAPSAPAASGTPAAHLGIYISAENSGKFSTISGQKPDIANTYLYWNSGWPSTFVSGAEAAGATPFIELEPWQGSSSGAPQFSDIVAGKYDSWLTGLGNNVKSLNKPVIFTFAHEFNVSGQYPWANGDKGSCGSSSCTPAQWIAAWNHVEAVVNKAAGGHAYWMWAPNADTGGTTTNPMAWWPGTNEVQMVGVDGYPDTTYGSQFGTFSGEFGPVFKEIRTKTNLPIFISETDLAPLGTSGYESIPSFIKDMAAAGGSGVLEWEDGSGHMTSAQWSQLDAALAQYVK